MSGPLAGLRCLVTGGGSGIGLAVTQAYLDRGAQVLVVERDHRAAETLRQERPGPALRLIEGDAVDPQVLDRAVQLLGAPDNLTCCVGVFDQYVSLRDLDPSRLRAAAEEIWRTNVLSVFTATAAVLPAMAERDPTAPAASLTVTLSESAFAARGGGVLYGSSKWALRGVVSHLAAELAPRIRVNGVAPGGTGGTRFRGLRSLGQDSGVDEVAGRDERIAAQTLLQTTALAADHAWAYSYLADPVAARVVTGTVLRTDGGQRS